jgi:origin recognition complex subunit 1
MLFLSNSFLQCVLAVISEFQRELFTDGLPSFDFISLNGMEMRDPFEAYVKLWTQLEGECSRCNAENSASRLEAYFTGKFVSNENEKTRVTVVLLDEIDYLVTKKQSVLYNFFDWPSRSLETKSNRRLVVIGVSNTLNLPERLHPRVQSRIGSKRVFFKSYSVNETVTILNAKVQQACPNYKVFDPDAILYASKKTAALSGDIRKAFHICRSAAEMILYEAESGNETSDKPIVRIKDVLKVSRESTNAAQPRSVGLCAPFQVLFLVALAALSKTTGREYGGFDVEEITTKMRSIADSFGDPMYLPPPTLPETLGMLSRLRDNHLVAMASPRDRSLSFRASLAGSGGPWPLVSMVMDDLAVLLALKETPHYNLAQKFLSRSMV